MTLTDLPRPTSTSAGAPDDALEVRDAASGGAAKREYVKRIFSEIAPRYDLLNHLLSFNIDRGWRARALDALGWRRAPEGRYLDLCAGTLDVSAQLSRLDGFKGSVLGADFAEPMLRSGRGKSSEQVVRPVVADALALPLADASMDGAIVAFGIRNVADLDACLHEVHRVLRPGARFVILEFSTPRSAIVRTGYQAYFHHVLPTIGGLVSGHRSAYKYLPESVKHFPEQRALAERMQRTGFAQVSWTDLTFGVAAIHVGEKAS
ncbi:MAG: bifunctional demethylmenaquinone methyltransferase/2-methoxy-6-polyprenyl-1,4-benzoquinol methylase UbiE [Cytophagaceae bacterium]|nr:bifunctional demethylmenaquinone methyltransferase/2-methoxy-6-polyprenyl-1,4-benzoquinol methylase UbiE [Gemmatimonadaceae bacterium]